ncbi:MAG: tetratricopeptide repeat protein [Gemmatimonadota bacterium]
MRLSLTGPTLVLLLATPLAAQDSPSREPSLAELEAAARQDSNDAVAHYRLAMGYWDKKRWDDVERELGQALVIAPNYADAHLAFGVLPARRGEGYWKDRIKKEGIDRIRAVYYESQSHYRRAFLLNPLVDLRVVGKFEEWGEFNLGGSLIFTLAPWWSHELVRSANEFREGRYQKAYDQLHRLMHDPRFGGQDVNVASDVLWFHGLAAAHVKNYDKAIRDFVILTGRSIAVERDTLHRTDQLPMRSNDYRFILATMLYISGDYDDAIPTFHRALEVDLGLYVAHTQLARMYEARGDLETALAERRLALDVQQDDPDLLIDLARTLLKAGRFEETRDPLADAARLNPRDARAPYLQATVAEALHDTAGASEAYSRFVAIAPSRFSDQIAAAHDRLLALSAKGTP